MVNPQAMCWLCPSATPGSPGSPAPMTSRSGSDEVNHVAQGGKADDAVRIVGKKRLAGCGESAGDGPVVAAFAGVGREFDALIAADEVLEQIGSETGEVETGCGIESDGGIEVKKFRGFFGSDVG